MHLLPKVIIKGLDVTLVELYKLRCCTNSLNIFWGACKLERMGITTV